MKTKFLQIIPIIGIIMVSISCRKDINVPSPEMENLFGTWELYSCDAYDDRFCPDKSQQIEFQKNGIYKIFEHSKKEERGKFSISKSNSLIYKNLLYQINYSDNNLFSNVPKISHVIEFQGKDTLILNEDAADGNSYTYVKK